MTLENLALNRQPYMRSHVPSRFLASPLRSSGHYASEHYMHQRTLNCHLMSSDDVVDTVFCTPYDLSPRSLIMLKF